LVRIYGHHANRIAIVIVHESLATGQGKNKREEKQPEDERPH